MKKLSLLTILLCAASLKAELHHEVQGKLDAHKAEHNRLEKAIADVKAQIEGLFAEIREFAGDHKHAAHIRAANQKIMDLQARHNDLVNRVAAGHAAHAKTRLAVDENHVQIVDGKATPVIRETKKPEPIVHQMPVHHAAEHSVR